MSSIAADLSSFTLDLRSTEIPPDIREQASLHLLDAIGCALAAHGAGLADEAVRLAIEDGGSAEATVIGGAARVPASAAAMGNGMLIHGLDYDDTHSDSVCHISASVVPAAIAVAQTTGSSGTDLIDALVIGNEIVARIGMAAASEFHHRGFHPTSVCGIFGATVAACRLYGLDKSQTTNALGIAGSMASGVLECLSDGSSTKRQHPGWAAHSGVLAARLARAGATGPATIFEGRFGLYNTYLSQNRSKELRALIGSLGSTWETARIAFKPFPACHFVHACVDAAREAADGRTLTLGEIQSVSASIPSAGVPVVAEPTERKLQPANGYEAKFSLQYCVAAMLINGSLDLQSFEPEAIRDPVVLAAAKKVYYEPGEFTTYPDAFPGRIKIMTEDAILESDVPYQRGGPENSMSRTEVQEKFLANAAGTLPRNEAATFADVVSRLDEQPRVASVFDPLAKAASGQRTAT